MFKFIGYGMKGDTVDDLSLVWPGYIFYEDRLRELDYDIVAGVIIITRGKEVIRRMIFMHNGAEWSKPLRNNEVI